MSENTQVVTQNTGTVAQKPKTFDMALMEKLDSVNDALPKDFNKQRFVQNTLALIHDNPKLMEYKQSEIMSGLMKGATLGLDFFNKEAYLVPYGSQLNYQTDYRGAKKLAKKYSIRPIKDIYAKLVREGDEFEEVIENGEQGINFKPKAFNDGKIRLCKHIELDFENPTQQSNFMAGMEIETDVSEIAHRKIAENENSQPFEVVADVEAKEEPSFVTEG